MWVNCTFARNMQRHLILLYIVVLAASSCNNYQKVLNGDDPMRKIAAADSLYNLEEYGRAKMLYDAVKGAYMPAQESRKILFRLAQSEFHTAEYYLASYHFNRFFEQYPYSGDAEEALYMHAFCQYQVSPKTSLDQNSTTKAIQSFQLFASRYPNSERIAQCNQYIDELRSKLEDKAFSNAALWHQIEDYKAAVTALGNFITDYPASQYREEASFLLVESNYLLATLSVPSKKEERFNNAKLAYRNFIVTYPNSAHTSELNIILSKIEQELKKLNNENG